LDVCRDREKKWGTPIFETLLRHWFTVVIIVVISFVKISGNNIAIFKEIFGYCLKKIF